MSWACFNEAGGSFAPGNQRLAPFQQRPSPCFNEAGAAAAPLRGPAYAWGLSPRVRGNPDAGALGNLIVGSIKVSATQHRRGDGECTRPK